MTLIIEFPTVLHNSDINLILFLQPAVFSPSVFISFPALLYSPSLLLHSSVQFFVLFLPSLLSCVSPYFAAVCIFYADSKTSDTGGQLQAEGEFCRSFLVACLLSSDALCLLLNLSPPPPNRHSPSFIANPPSPPSICCLLPVAPSFFPSSTFLILSLSLSFTGPKDAAG